MGTGKRLFADPGPKIPLQLTANKVTPKGVLVLTYVPD